MIDKITEIRSIIGDFENNRQKQIDEGINDANVFTTLLSATDEVRLHSRFLKFLLDPNENHYKSDSFLKSFLEKIRLSEFGLNTKEASVWNESENIDIYITDGKKHIILENKIWAGDQYEQIERYINTIKSKNESLQNQDLAVVYLTPTGWDLSESSLKGNDGIGFSVEGNSIISTENKEEFYEYRKISYKNQIIEWLNNVLEDIKDISNLCIIVNQYKKTVLEVLGKSEENVMGFKKYLDSKDNKNEIIKNMREISEQYDDYMYDVWKEISNELKSKGFQCGLSGKHNFGGKNFTALTINGRFQVVYENSKYLGLYYGIDKKYKKPKPKNIKNTKEAPSPNWWDFEYCNEEEFVEKFIEFYNFHNQVWKEISNELESKGFQCEFAEKPKFDGRNFIVLTINDRFQVVYENFQYSRLYYGIPRGFTEPNNIKNVSSPNWWDFEYCNEEEFVEKFIEFYNFHNQ